MEHQKNPKKPKNSRIQSQVPRMNDSRRHYEALREKKKLGSTDGQKRNDTGMMQARNWMASRQVDKCGYHKKKGGTHIIQELVEKGINME